VRPGAAARARLRPGRDRARSSTRRSPLPRQSRPSPQRPGPAPWPIRAPNLRANPFPKVTDPSCRLPLPTLFYRLEAGHLGDLLRIWVRSGATPPRAPHPSFQGRYGRLPMPPRIGDTPRIKSQNPISLREVSRASAASGEKKTLPEAPVRVLGLCRVAATSPAGRPPKGPPYRGLASQRDIGSAAGFRNFGLIPFRPCHGEELQHDTSRQRTRTQRAH
jgi:hypothetical protein